MHQTTDYLYQLYIDGYIILNMLQHNHGIQPTKSVYIVTSGVHFTTQCLPSGSPSAHVARTKALVITTTFASCILVIPAPVLWNR